MADGRPTRIVAVPGKKFSHPDVTADGAVRARVDFRGLETLWVNTGTLCNIACEHCYIESSPTNDKLSYITPAELAPFFDEAQKMGAREIGFTGGEPFMNPDITDMIEAALAQGFSVLVLTNAMRPMMRLRIKQALQELLKKYKRQIKLRVSLDHYDAAHHNAERGAGGYAATLTGLKWLAETGFAISVAGRLRWQENDAEMRKGFADLFAAENLPLNADDPHSLILFPEMDAAAAVPEITSDCWRILGNRPEDMMCATARMIVKRKGAAAPSVLSCTLLTEDRQFEMGATLKEATGPVKLNHPHCAKFCVLGGASCSG